jgi:hypothetical protein
MAAKQRPPLTPADAEYVGLARIAGAAPPVEARHLLRWPSRSRPGKEHFSSCDERGGDIRCTCEAWTYRGACGHAAGHLDTLAHIGVTFGPPPVDPGGAGRVFAPCHRCPAPRTCARDGCRLLRAADPGFATPLDPDDEGPFAGGAALDAAQASLDGELDDWLPAALRDHMRRRFDEAVAADGDRWIQSRTSAGVRLTCSGCSAVRGWASEGMATAWLEGGGACRCGGEAPTRPEHGAARKPLSEHLGALYGDS